MASSGNSYGSPPESHELEVSIFGPGFGECIVLHLGNQEWAVIDSCLDPISKSPAALRYFESIGVSVARSVRLIVATHWHDDHIHGISRLFQHAKAAAFACTQVVREPDFNEILGVWSDARSLPGGSGIDELRSILHELSRRTQRSSYPTPKLASANKILWERAQEPIASIRALSPSDAAAIASISRLRTEQPQLAKARRRLPNLKPNDASVVLSVVVGDQNVLLGSDLQVRADRNLGWFAIFDEIAQDAVPHQVFKVAHHGSPNADHLDIWSRMLMREPWAIATPFVSGNVRLPSLDDCRRIMAQTQNAFLTAPPHPARFRDASRAVERTMKEATIAAYIIPGKFGHVRCRKHIAAPACAAWRVELLGNALRMEDFAAAAR